MSDWPENVVRLAVAIKVAEGSNPDWNNPLDLTWAPSQYPSIGVANSEGVLKFADYETGWDAGCHQVELMLTGRSDYYKLTMTLAEVGLIFAHGDPNWSVNVAKELGVSPDITLAEIAGSS